MGRMSVRRWLPLAVLVLGCALSFLAWHATRDAIHGNFRRALNGSANLHAGLLSADLAAAKASIGRVVSRWDALKGTSPDIWRTDAAARIAAYVGVAAFDRIDIDLHRRARTTATEHSDVDEALALDAAERARLESRPPPNTLIVGDVKTDAAGMPYVMFYMPLYVGDRLDGFLGWQQDLKALMAAQVRKSGTANHIELRAGDQTLAAFGDPADDKAAAAFVGRVPVDFEGLKLDVVALPTAAFLVTNRDGLPGGVLTLGLLLTLLLTFLAYLWVQLAVRATALREAHEKAAEQARLYRELLRRAELGYVVTDLAGTVLDVNEPGVRMAGCAAAADMIGHSINEFLPDDERAKRAAHVTKAMNTTGTVHRDVTLRRANGDEVQLSVDTIVDQLGADGARLISLSQDITESARFQREILEGKRIYEEIFENADVAIVDIDMSHLFTRLGELRLAGISDLAAYLAEDQKRLFELCRLTRINTMNRAGLRLFGSESVEYVQSIDYFMEKGRPDQVREFALGIWRDIPGIRREVSYSSFTGRDIALIYSLRLPKTAAQARRVPVVVLDVTEVRSAEGARQASIAKSQFLASMSHEIRTPLNGVIGNLELLAQTDMRSDQEELLFDAEKAAKSLLALIGNILDFSKIEAGKLTIESVELNPAAIVQEAIDIVQSRARQKGIFVTGFVAPDVPEIVKGDPTRIRQILLNLLGNSVKFTSQGGVHINLRVKDWDDSICQLLFTVHDSGRGFDQATADELFQPFTQDRKRTSEDFGGTGLGLSICRSLVDTFGGEIDCESVRGEGASFWFTLPVQVVKASSRAGAPDLSGRAVLFVNADADRLPGKLTQYLVERGATILTAADEDTALSMSRKAMAQKQPIDLAIYVSHRNQWPNSSLADALRECNTVPMVRAAEATPELWRKALRSGASYLLPDTFDPAFFDRNIHQAFGGLAQVHYAMPRESAAVDTSVLAGKHALVLEDRLVNQTIIQRQLKKFQMTCTLAGDGIVGLEKLAQGAYDLILCDCSMPEMNGFEFTRILRQREAEKGDGHRIPVIAMTANAFREDREKCFDAGMDDFVSKPVTMHRLASVLTTWITKAPGAAAPEAIPPASRQAHIPRPVDERPAHGAAIDLGLLENLLGSSDREMIAEIMAEFVAAAADSWREVQASAEKRDPVELTKAAHGAKGEARNVGAVTLGDLYEELEKSAKQSAMGDIDTLMAAIPGELRRVQSFANEIAARKSA